MEMNSRKVDPEKRERGAWVDSIPEWDDLRLKVRGVSNSDYRRLESQLVAAVPRNKRIKGRIAPEESDRITSACLLNTCLLDWENVSENGKPVPYSKEAAQRYMLDPEWTEFRNAVAYAAGTVAEAQDEANQDVLGNSSSASAGT